MPSRSERSSTLRSVSVSIVLITPDSDRPNGQRDDDHGVAGTAIFSSLASSRAGCAESCRSRRSDQQP